MVGPQRFPLVDVLQYALEFASSKPVCTSPVDDIDASSHLVVPYHHRHYQGKKVFLVEEIAVFLYYVCVIDTFKEGFINAHVVLYFSELTRLCGSLKGLSYFIGFHWISVDFLWLWIKIFVFFHSELYFRLFGMYISLSFIHENTTIK